MPNRRQRDQTALVLDLEFFSMATLRNMDMIKLAKTGDSERSMLVTEYTLVSRNEAASGKITDLTTS